MGMHGRELLLLLLLLLLLPSAEEPERGQKMED